MDFQCFGPCGCDKFDGVTKADLDRFTDKIENILTNENGRRLFKNYLITCKFRVGRRTLDLWERVDKLLISTIEPESAEYSTKYLTDVNEVINLAERVDEIDFALLERLNSARETGGKPDIVHMLKILRSETAKALSREYVAFKRHFVRPNK